jgi:hypothetical protein
LVWLFAKAKELFEKINPDYKIIKDLELLYNTKHNDKNPISYYADLFPVYLEVKRKIKIFIIDKEEKKKYDLYVDIKDKVE